jgi:hypothetical protein
MNRRRLLPLEHVFLRLFVVFAAVSWMGILLAELGQFSVAAVASLAAPAAAVGWWLVSRGNRELGGAGLNGTTWRGYFGLALALALSAALTARRGDYLIEGADASVYVGIGRALLESGGLRAPDPLLESVPAATRDALLARTPEPPHLLQRFPGGIDVQAGGQALVPGFFHLLPTWVALFEGVGGRSAAYSVNVLMALVSLFAAWAIGRRLWSEAAGTVAALLIATSFGQVWFARLPSSEMLAQALLLAAVLLTIVAHDSRSRPAAALAGVAVGLAGFARIDSLFLLTPLAAGWLIACRRRPVLGAAWGWYAGALALVAGHAAAHAALFARPYVARLGTTAVSAVRAQVGAHALLLVSGLAALAVLAVVARRMSNRASVPIVASTLLVVAAASSPGVSTSAALLFTPVGTAAVVAGFLLAVHEGGLRVIPAVAPFACQAALWLAWREQTVLPDDFRRFVPAVLPLGMIFVGGLTIRLGAAAGRARPLAWLLPGAIVLLSLVQFVPALREPAMQSVHAQVQALAERLPAGSVVLADRLLPGHLALALQTTFGRPSIRVMGRPPAGALRAFVSRASAKGRNVFFVAGDSADDPRQLRAVDFDGLRLDRMGEAPLRFTTLAASRTSFPRQLRRASVDVRLYRVQPGAWAERRALPARLEIGGDDFAWLDGGFHSTEAMPSAAARWTDGLARLRLPPLSVPDGRTLVLALRLAMTRPPGVALPHVEVRLDGEALGSVVDPVSGLTEYRLAVPGVLAARLASGGSILELRSATFSPRESGGSEDGRTLGIVVDWIQFEIG